MKAASEIPILRRSEALKAEPASRHISCAGRYNQGVVPPCPKRNPFRHGHMTLKCEKGDFITLQARCRSIYYVRKTNQQSDGFLSIYSCLKMQKRDMAPGVNYRIQVNHIGGHARLMVQLRLITEYPARKYRCRRYARRRSKRWRNSPWNRCRNS